MNTQELLGELTKAFYYCRANECVTCPKNGSCDMIFPNKSILETVIDLALDCKEFNESEVDD